MLALFLALRSPELDVRGISVSYGNTVAENAYRNAVEIVRRAGRRATLGVGARRPLRRPLTVARETHGESGLGYAALPPAGLALEFVRPLERLLGEQPEPVTLVTLGPLTSLALTLRRDVALVRAKVRRHIAMAGNLAAQGNTTPFSEFNAWCDPEALDIVLRAELPTEMVGLDVTREAVLEAQEVARLGHSSAQEGLDGCIVNDLLPIAVLLKPDTLVFEDKRLVVDLADDDHRGHTRADPAGALVRVATRVDMTQVRRLLSERVLRWATRPKATTDTAERVTA